MNGQRRTKICHLHLANKIQTMTKWKFLAHKLQKHLIVIHYVLLVLWKMSYMPTISHQYSKGDANTACTQTGWAQLTQPFYGSVEFVRENPGEPVPEETFTHYSHRSHQLSLSAFSI